MKAVVERAVRDEPSLHPLRRFHTVIACASGWLVYGPVGLKYLTFLLLACSGLVLLGRTSRWQDLRRIAFAAPAAALWLVLALSAAWTVAPAASITSHLWLYALPLMAWVIAAATPIETASRALAHFAAASAALGGLFVIARLDMLPTSWLWDSTLQASGNQRIANSLLLALGSAVAVWLATNSRITSRRGVTWLAAAALAAAGLALQDRRSGMALLPLLAIVWVLTQSRTLTRRVAWVAAVLLATLLTWQFVDGVRARFAEGKAELIAYQHTDTVSTSWGQRLRMIELTAELVRERPLLGHGLASWRTLWLQRVQAGTPLAANTTPHNEYLYVAVQCGVLGLASLIWLMAAPLSRALRAGCSGIPSMLVWVSIAFAGLFNAVLRDARLALPLLLLAAIAAAVQGRNQRSP